MSTNQNNVSPCYSVRKISCGTPWATRGHHEHLHVPQGNFCSSTSRTSSPSFCIDLGVCRAVSFCIFSFLSPSCCGTADFPFLKYDLTEGKQHHPLSSGQRQVPFEAIWHWFLSDMGQNLQWFGKCIGFMWQSLVN